MKWVCRGKEGLDKENIGLPGCYWRERLWKIGEEVEVSGVDKWVYSGGFWHPEGMKEVKDYNLLIPRHFEPVRKVLVDPKDLLNARMGTWIDPLWEDPKADPVEAMKSKIKAEYKDEIEQAEEDERVAEDRVEHGKTERETVHRRAKKMKNSFSPALSSLVDAASPPD